jgi:hypothetical protein
MTLAMMPVLGHSGVVVVDSVRVGLLALVRLGVLLEGLVSPVLH